MTEKGAKGPKTKKKSDLTEATFQNHSNELIRQSLDVHNKMISELSSIHEKLISEVREIDQQINEDESHKAVLRLFEIEKQRAEFYANLVGYQVVSYLSFQEKLPAILKQYETDHGKKKTLLTEWISELDKLQNNILDFGEKACERINAMFDQKLEECRELYENFEKLGKFEAQNNELAILSSEKTKLEDTLSIKEKEVSQLTESVINLEQALKRLQVYSPIEKIDQEIPYLSINTESIKSLSQEGWKISSQHKDRVFSIQNSKVALVSIIGEIGSGKSWVAGQLNFNRGWRNPPKSLSIHYACRSEGNWFGTLISSAWNEPIKPREKPLSTTDPQQNSNSQLMEIYKELTDDSKLIENLILSYLIGSGHLILLVIEQLTQSELEKIQVVKRLIRNSQKNPRLIIMHNFKQISKREHMEKKINNCLRKIFQFEEQPLFNDTKTLDGEGDIHKNLFKDEFGIIHLVTAAESTPAGEFYNRGPFKFLLSKIDMLENKETFSFCENFVEYCNTRLINLAGVDFALKCIDDKIFATNKQAKITPSALNYSANVFSQGEFDPKYSTKLEWLSGGDEARVIVEIEVLDSMIEKKALRVIEGYHYLTVAGTRKEIFSEEEKQKGNEGKMLLTKGTRREGNYVLDIRLIGVFMDRKPDLEVQEEDSEFGIKRITVEFVKPKEQMI